jgi:hypothetical protein
VSEYKWKVKKAWIGVMRRIKDERGLFKEDKLLGVIRRSGTVQAMGHFCFVDVQVCGKKYAASGAEDRIFPFHSIVLEEGDKTPELELEYIGWCKDHETPAFRTKEGELVELVGAGSAGGAERGSDSIAAIPRSNWPEKLVETKEGNSWEETKPGVLQRKSSS